MFSYAYPIEDADRLAGELAMVGPRSLFREGTARIPHRAQPGLVWMHLRSSAWRARTLLPHLARSAPRIFFRLKIVDDPKETGDRVRVPEVARVLVALRFALVPQAAKVVDHALE